MKKILLMLLVMPFLALAANADPFIKLETDMRFHENNTLEQSIMFAMENKSGCPIIKRMVKENVKQSQKKVEDAGGRVETVSEFGYDGMRAYSPLIDLSDYDKYVEEFEKNKSQLHSKMGINSQFLSIIDRKTARYYEIDTDLDLSKGKGGNTLQFPKSPQGQEFMGIKLNITIPVKAKVSNADEIKQIGGAYTHTWNLDYGTVERINLEFKISKNASLKKNLLIALAIIIGIFATWKKEENEGD